MIAITSLCVLMAASNTRASYYYWYWSWKCYVCRRLCQRLALFQSPFALAGLVSDPVCDTRFHRRTNMFPVHGVFFPLWSRNFDYRNDVSVLSLYLTLMLCANRDIGEPSRFIRESFQLFDK